MSSIVLAAIMKEKVKWSRDETKVEEIKIDKVACYKKAVTLKRIKELILSVF
jgi:hypothetical protein